jgi:hypothetical protein
MQTAITKNTIEEFTKRLENHPIYEAITTLEDLQCFMQHHIYSVWDFMSLIKYLQNEIAPTSYPWTPKNGNNSINNDGSNGSIKRFINELVLEEESDETNISGTHSSHFELYQKAMLEIGADITPSVNFINSLQTKNIREALTSSNIPEPSRVFTTQTFDFIESGKPHQVASALALGREHIIPCIFRSILKNIGITESQAPIFHYYLNRHIGLDEDFHAPLSLRLLNSLCDDDEQKTTEAIDAAKLAVNARLKFWDGVLEAINLQKNNT